VLTEGEQRALSAICDALVPSLDPRPGDNAALFRLSAADVALVADLDPSPPKDVDDQPRNRPSLARNPPQGESGSIQLYVLKTSYV